MQPSPLACSSTTIPLHKSSMQPNLHVRKIWNYLKYAENDKNLLGEQKLYEGVMFANLFKLDKIHTVLLGE